MDSIEITLFEDSPDWVRNALSMIVRQIFTENKMNASLDSVKVIVTPQPNDDFFQRAYKARFKENENKLGNYIITAEIDWRGREFLWFNYSQFKS